MQASGTSRGKETRTETLLVRAAFLCVAVMALLLRVWGIRFGIGLPRGRPDEELFVIPALRMFGGDLNPHFAGGDLPGGFFLFP